MSRADGIFTPLRNEERSATILQYFDDNPSGSVRRAGAGLNITPNTGKFCGQMKLPSQEEESSLHTLAPHFLPPRIYAATFLEFLEDIPLQLRERACGFN
ncbi:unnamed protein product [Nezara viridula]|uniref:Uncharacterized protein n=1 Tax=Nezara viridula TaxID=85310 RepID=A0A9P0H640_NEZVI|nr:unnamed protein product [Nezara viridula]